MKDASREVRSWLAKGHLEWVRYARSVPAIRTGTMGWLRTSVGLALMIAPGAPMRLAGSQSPTVPHSF
jgi:hypothetical protein